MLVARPPRGLDLPAVSVDGLRSCRVRANSTLQECALLLPAGTGTQSLHDVMRAVLGSARREQLAHGDVHSCTCSKET